MKEMISNKIKVDIIQKVSKLCLSAKESKLFSKVLEKGIKNWNDIDIEFLNLLYEKHHFPALTMACLDIYPWEQQESIKRDTLQKRENAVKRLAEEPYSSWFKDVRHYAKTK